MTFDRLRRHLHLVDHHGLVLRLEVHGRGPAFLSAPFRGWARRNQGRILPGLLDIEPRNHHPDRVRPDTVLEAVPAFPVSGREAVKRPAVRGLEHHIRPGDRLAGVGVRHTSGHDGVNQ